jgi:hypothetical protein
LHIQTHILSGWCAANLVPFCNARQRLFCMIAASIPDIDGAGILLWPINHTLGQELYWDYHHRLGHCILFGIVVSSLLAVMTRRRYLASFLLYLAMFHLHLALDLAGSGEGWKIHYWWPLNDLGYSVSWVWDLSSWQNRLAFLLLLIWTIGIAYWQRRTPLELLMPSLDEKFTRRGAAAPLNAPPQTPAPPASG